GATPSASTGGLFGAGATPAASTGGLFGASTTPAAPTGGLFGAGATPPASTGGLFGAGVTPPASTGGLFGAGTTPPASTGGLFGATVASAAPTTSNDSVSSSLMSSSGSAFASSLSGTSLGTDSSNTMTSSIASSPISTSLFASSSGFATFPVLSGTIAKSTAAPTTSGLFGTTATAKPTNFSFSPSVVNSLASSPSVSGTTIGSQINATSSSSLNLSLPHFGSTANAVASTGNLSSTLPNVEEKKAPLPSPRKAAIESIQHERIDDLVSNWEKRVQRKVQTFNLYSELVAEIDRNIIFQSQRLAGLRKEQQLALTRQQHFAQIIQNIEQQQQNLAPILNSIESNLKKKLADYSERKFDTSAVLMTSQQLQRLDQQVNEISELFTQVSESTQPDILFSANQTLALQEASLEAMSAQSEQLEARIAALQHRIPKY
ncbi:hypothetical protein IE077_001567, partial [Cardiosporidium cionae]